MKTTNKPLFDSNILIYSVNADSPFHATAFDLLERYTQSGFYVADINLIEFFQVVTDGRKTLNPFSTEQATEYIRKLVRIPQVNVLKTRSFHEIVQDDEAHAEVRRLQIKRFAIYDYLIADCMRQHDIKPIITGNARDFQKFPFLDVIDPFADSLASDQRPRATDPGYIPYGRQSISEQDVSAVCSVLRSDFLTQGPKVPAFEQAVAEYCGAKHAVAVNSATSALHIACLALGLGPGDTLWTSPITFVASANCALYCGAKVDFVDIDPRTYNMSVSALEAKLVQAKQAGGLPKVVVPVHMCGQPCDMQSIHALSREYGFRIIEDASHAIGAKYQDEPVGNCRYSDITVFSFHPVKIITTGEGGMALTNDPELARLMECFRTHGITSNKAEMQPRPANEIWNYQQIRLGCNYRMTDIQAALGLSQMTRLDDFIEKRRQIAARYDTAFADLPMTTPLQHPDGRSSYHLYPIRVRHGEGPTNQRQVYDAFLSAGVSVNLHYIPVYRQPYYEAMGFAAGYCPEAELYHKETISLPMFPSLTGADQERVINILHEAMA